MDEKIDVSVLADARNELLSKIQKGSPDYRSGYADGVLDMFNTLKDKIQPVKITVG